MKKLTGKLLLVCLTLLSALCLLAACASVGEISIKTMPRTIYVVGQELDLSEGVLSVSEKGGSREIPLNSADISVSGYEKDRTGTQEITIEYKGKSVKMTVNVVPRMIAENIETQYFVGESLNLEKGRLRITRDDGSNFAVNMNDPSLTFGNFDSSSPAQEVKISVGYSKDGSYSGEITVAVYAADKSELTKPNKNVYGSHEKTLDLSGGFITLSNQSAGITRYVELLPSMITGFDPNAVSLENPTKTQTLTVLYAGKEYTFDLTIRFSNVSLIQLRAEELKKLDWTGTEPPEISEENGENALEAVRLYSELSVEDEKYLTDEEITPIVRAAAVYGYQKWLSAAKKYEEGGVFLFEGGRMQLIAKSYQAVKDGIQALSSPDEPLYTVGKILEDLALRFETTEVLGGVTVAQYLSGVYPTENLQEIPALLSYMITLYDALEEVPEEWTYETLEEHAQAIGTAQSYVANTQYRGTGYRFIYDLVSSWRKNDDYFDILYTYFFYLGATDPDLAVRAVDSIKDIHLYGKLEELFGLILTQFNQLVDIQEGYAPDTSLFLLNYQKSLELVEEIQNSDDEMLTMLYGYLSFDELLSDGADSVAASYPALLQFLRTTLGGVNYHSFAYLDDEKFDGMLKEYLSILKKADEDSDYSGSEEYGEDIDHLFLTFAEATSTYQYNLLAALNTYYRSGVPALALDYTENGAYTYFVYLIANRFGSILSESAQEVFQSLLIAMEYNAQRMDGTLENFQSQMEETVRLYNALSPADKKVFDDKCGKVYEKYKDLSKNLGNKIDLGEWEDEFLEIGEAVLYINQSVQYIQQGAPFQNVLYAVYESAKLISDKILTEAPDEIKYAYYYQTYPLIEGRAWTMEDYMFYSRYALVTALTELTFSMGDATYVLWDSYRSDEMRAFMADASSVMLTYLATDPTKPDEAPQFDGEQVKKALASYRNLTITEQFLFRAFESDLQIFYSGVTMFCTKALSEEESAVARLLLTAEDLYLDYAISPDGTYQGADGKEVSFRDDFINAMKLAIQEYNKLQNKSKFEEYLGDMYNYYLEIYNKISESD